MSALRLTRQSTFVDSTKRSEVSHSMLKEHKLYEHEYASPFGLNEHVYCRTPQPASKHGRGTHPRRS